MTPDAKITGASGRRGSSSVPLHIRNESVSPTTTSAIAAAAQPRQTTVRTRSRGSGVSRSSSGSSPWTSGKIRANSRMMRSTRLEIPASISHSVTDGE
jgi:hypothetical protein